MLLVDLALVLRPGQVNLLFINALLEHEGFP